jgi:hypothetical protein
MLPRLSAQERKDLAQRARRLSNDRRVPAKMRMALRRHATNLDKISAAEAKRQRQK